MVYLSLTETIQTICSTRIVKEPKLFRKKIISKKIKRMIFNILKVNYLKSCYLLLIILIFCIDAYSKSLIDTLEYEDGIFVEPLLSSKTDRKDYNEDNIIFTVNKKFVVF